MQVGYGKLKIFHQYLGNDTRYGHSYRGMPIGAHNWSIEWCHF